MRALVQKFLKNEGGNFAIIMGLVLVPVLSLAGAAVDYSQLYNTRSKMQSAADSAILAAAKDSRTVNEYYSLTEAYLTANLPDLDLEIIPKAGPKSVTLRVVNKFEPSFLGLAGINMVPIEVNAEVAIEKFSTGKTAKRNGQFKVNGKPASDREVMAALKKLRTQMLKSVDRLPHRKQADMRRRINAKFDRLMAQAASGGGGSSPVYLSK